MKSILFIALLISSIESESATLKGWVGDSQTHDPLPGANVILLSTKLGVATNTSGHFEIDNIPVGHYIVRATYIGYLRHDDTISISASDEVQELHIPLSTNAKAIAELQSQLLTTAEQNEITAYQDSLEAIERHENILTVVIDSLYWNTAENYNGELMARLSIHNNCKLLVFVLKNYPCMMRLSACILDSLQDTMKTREIFFDHVGDKCQYDPSDILQILPDQSIQYPTTIIWLRNYRSLPNGKYSVHVIYSYQRPQMLSWLSGRFPNKEGFMTYLKAVQGRFISDNVWQLINVSSKTE